MPQGNISIIFTKKLKIAPDTYTFYFKRPTGFTYSPGQYIKLILDFKEADIRGKSRFFTLSSSPTEKHLSITTRILRSSFKKRLSNLGANEVVLIRGPFGVFKLDVREKRRQVFISGGIGITPFLSVAKYIRDKKLTLDILHLALYKNQKNAIFENEIKKLVSQNYKFISHMSGIAGRINGDVLERYIANSRECVYYIAGSLEMVESMQAILKKMGIDKENIKAKDFPGY